MNEPWIEDAKRLMEKDLIEGSDGSLMPRLFVRRNDETVVIFFCQNGRFLASLARIAVAGFEADELVFVSDTWRATTPTNPEGKPWEHGEMSRRAEEPAVRAILQEAVWMMQIKRGMTHVVADMQPYRRESGGRLIWIEDEKWQKVKEEPSLQVEGVIPDFLVEAINQKAILQQLAQSLDGKREDLEGVIGLPIGELEVRTQLTTIKFMMGVAENHNESFAVALIAPDNDRMADLFKQGLGELKNVRVESFKTDRATQWPTA